MNKLIAFVVFFSSLNVMATPKIWTVPSFVEACKNFGGKVKSVDYNDDNTLSCGAKNGEQEIMYAWFDKSTTQMQGWVDRKKDDHGKLMADVEYDRNGELKEESIYFNHDGDVSRMIVFNKNHEVLRGVVVLAPDVYVINSANDILKNGSPIRMETFIKLFKNKLNIAGNGNQTLYELVRTTPAQSSNSLASPKKSTK